MNLYDKLLSYVKISKKNKKKKTSYYLCIIKN